MITGREAGVVAWAAGAPRSPYHRNIKRRTRPMLGFKSFWTARVVLGGIELVHMLRKGQLASTEADAFMTAAEAFYLLAA